MHKNPKVKKDASREDLGKELCETRARLAKKEKEYRELSKKFKRLKDNSIPANKRTFHAAFNQTTGISSIYDPKRRLQYVNDRKAQLSDVDVDEMIGRRDEEVVPLEICSQYLPFLEKVYETKQPQNLELYLPEHFGGATHIVQYLPVFDGNGEIIQVFGIATDITKQKQIEHALRESRERLRIAVEVTRLGIWEYDPETESVLWNERSRVIFGVSADEKIDLNKFISIIHPEDREMVLKTLETGLDPSRGKGELEFRIVRGDGKIRWIHATGQVYFEEKASAKKAVHVTGTNLDITERKHAEKKLRESERKFQNLFNNSSDPIFIHELEGRILEVNEVTCKQLGYTRDELLKMKLEDIDSPENTCKMQERLRSVSKNSRVVFESVHRSNDGNEIHVEVNSRIIEYENKECVLSVVRDITRRKLAENALRHLNETLEQRVAERTELAEARLAELNSLAAELFEAEERERKRIAQLLHDDLQQLLVSARMKLQSVSPENLSPEMEDLEPLLSESIEKSRRLSHELSPPVLRQSDLKAAMEWLAHKAVDQFGLSVELETDEIPPLKNASVRVFLFRALQELLFNVVKHSGVKSARVSLIRSGDEILIQVTDRGCGFNPSDLGTTGSTAGMGLLTLRERSSSMGCSLKIESDLGQGSRFTLSVPLNLVEGERL